MQNTFWLKKNRIFFTIMLLYIMYITKNYWMGIIAKLIGVLFPFFFSFVLAYILNPIVKSLIKINIKRRLAIFIVVLSIGFTIYIFIMSFLPFFCKEISQLSTLLIMYAKNFLKNYDVDNLSKSNLINYIYNIIVEISNLFTPSIITVFTNSIKFITTLFYMVIGTIYFLIYIDKINDVVKKVLTRKPKLYKIILRIDSSLKLYVKGLILIIVITFFEYLLSYILVKHPSFFLLALLAALANIIPYFGSLFTNILAVITASIVSKELFIKCIILSIILSIIDSYIINPIVYKNTNKLNPLVIIISTVVFSSLFGFMGMIFALPITITIIEVIKFIKIEKMFCD